jgi:hypothetical protein
MAVRAERPHIPDYGIPEDTEGLMSFEDAAERLAASRNYWICTVRPDGRPHAMPVWGVWVDGHIYFGGGPDTVKARNLRANPHVVIHGESGDQVVVIEGVAEPVVGDDEQTRVDNAYEVKYDMRHGPVVWRVRAEKAFAWTEFPRDVTRWRFGA